MRVRSAFLIEGLRIDDELRLAPLVVRPVGLERGYFGKDGREIFNAELADAGLVTHIGRPAWSTQIGPRHRLALVLSDVLEVDDAPRGTLVSTAMVSRLADLLALTEGGAPRVVAGVTEVCENGPMSWRTLAIMAGSGPWPGSKHEKLAPGGSPRAGLDVAAVWSSLTRDPRTAFWLSLHRGIAPEPRWDVRMFRRCSLLETVGGEVIGQGAPVIDDQGRPLRGPDGRAATTSTLRGAIYTLVRRSLDVASLPDGILCAHPSRTLWDEIDVWAEVRNAVAHEGGWRPADPNVPRSRRVIEAFELAGRGDGLESGWLRYDEACAAAAELVLRAAAVGHLPSRARSS